MSVPDKLAEFEDGVDPRVKDELDALNAASVEINKLETEIDKARNKFRMLLTESTSRLNLLHKKLGKAVDKARPYYEQLKETRKAEVELQKATVKFQRANSLYRAAKETVALAEERMDEKTSDDERPEFDSAWQEMMNHATMRFMESEKERTVAEQEHQQRAGAFSAAQHKLHFLEKDIPRSINRSRPYFDLKDNLETRLQQERQSVEDLQRALTAAKEIYRTALTNLERISEEIHAARRQQCHLDLPPRTPGVGAEADSCDSLSINLDIHSLKGDVLLDEADVASLSSQDVSFILDCQAHTDESVQSSTADSHPLACSGVETTFISHKATSKNSVPPLTARPSGGGTSLGAIPKQTLSSRSIDRNRHKNVTTSASEKAESQGESSDSSPKASPREGSDSKARGRPKDKKVQRLNPSHFPILQGLTETNKKMSPRLPEGRPKGNEIPRHSPSPVRKDDAGFYMYPEAQSHKGIAREIEGGEKFFNGVEESAQRKISMTENLNKKGEGKRHSPRVAIHNKLPWKQDTETHKSDKSVVFKDVQNRPRSIPNLESAIESGDNEDRKAGSEDRYSPRGEGEGSPSESQPTNCTESRALEKESSDLDDSSGIEISDKTGLNRDLKEERDEIVYQV